MSKQEQVITLKAEIDYLKKKLANAVKGYQKAKNAGPTWEEERKVLKDNY